MVVKVDDEDLRRRLGQVSKSPRWAVAYKFPPEEEATLVEKIDVQVGRTGALTPVAHLKPVKVGGVTVARATLHNEDELRRKDVRKGDTVFIRRAGDVIPEIVKVVRVQAPPRTPSPSCSPTNCPVCGAAAVKDEEGAIIRCTGASCPAQLVEKLRHFASRTAMDIDGLGDKLCRAAGGHRAGEDVRGPLPRYLGQAARRSSAWARRARRTCWPPSSAPSRPPAPLPLRARHPPRGRGHRQGAGRGLPGRAPALRRQRWRTSPA